MLIRRRPWQEELEIIDRTMKAISGITDPEELVDAYWSGIGELLPIEDYVAVSRRGVEPPYYLITRSSRFTENINPWTQRDRLPRLTGGLLGEIAFGNKPVVIDDLPSRLLPDDPAHFYLEGFQGLVALPQYDGGEGLNVTMMLVPPGIEIDHAAVPVLHWQSGLFGRGTQSLVLRNQLSGALAALDRELQVVGEIQRSLLPRELPAVKGLDLAAYYLTSARAGGDYYDFFPLADEGVGLFIADVSGHGTPAAVFMAITHAIAHSQPGTHTPPAALLTHLNVQLARLYTRDGTFVTAFYAVLDPGSRTLTYSTAGHNPPRLVRNGRVQSMDKASSLPLGILEVQLYSQATVQLEPADLVVFYTDGITEAMGAPASDGSRPLFGVERLDRVLIDCTGHEAQQCVERVNAAVAAFTADAPATDDRTLIVMRCA
ncbi:MAG: PP2C family protein-serine/threonine phosphatase [Phycisphaerales bacterium]|nr:PP2C family protein-serine/threonine phosphatase [Phycisphaerales bacterium]